MNQTDWIDKELEEYKVPPQTKRLIRDLNLFKQEANAHVIDYVSPDKEITHYVRIMLPENEIYDINVKAVETMIREEGYESVLNELKLVVQDSAD